MLAGIGALDARKQEETKFSEMRWATRCSLQHIWRGPIIPTWQWAGFFMIRGYPLILSLVPVATASLAFADNSA